MLATRCDLADRFPNGVGAGRESGAHLWIVNSQRDRRRVPQLRANKVILSRNLIPQVRKVTFIPHLIPQADWDKYHFYGINPTF